MPAGASVDRRGSSVSAQDAKLSVATALISRDALDAEISAENQDILDAEDYLTGASRGATRTASSAAMRAATATATRTKVARWT